MRGATEFKELSVEKFEVFKNAFRSREGFKYFIETHDTALDKHGHVGAKETWSNEDLDPTPPEKRTCESPPPSAASTRSISC